MRASRTLFRIAMASMLAGSTALLAAAAAQAVDCTPTSDTTDGSGARIIVFTTVGTCTFTVDPDTSVQVLVVGGGGAGASSDDNVLGGGGGGGVAEGTVKLSGTLTVTVGDGGIGRSTCAQGTNGEDSSLADASVTITAAGGGRGGGCGDAGDGQSGGSGGGAHPWDGDHLGGTATQGSVLGTTSITLHGNAGGSAAYRLGGGGGGGAGAAAPTVTTTAGGAGGAGFTSTITGTSTVYGSGGGGSGTSGGTGGSGAGNGSSDTVAATAGTDGTGGGGGGGYVTPGGGKDGGSGIVVLKISTTVDLTSAISSYLDAPAERASKNFLLKASADMTSGKCQGSSTSFISVTLSLQKRRLLNDDEAAALIAAARAACP